MIVATAGHIDHGKTLLVKTLTGVDTDRLPEEKARGISIDLGFAYWATASGAVIGFVDVPGHERFIRNMVAGVCGIDFALIAVAADDGVMPQTVEHLNILELLGVSRGIAVITKTDRVGPDRVEQVRADVAALLGPTRLARSRILAVSPVSGVGMDTLREELAGAVGELVRRKSEGQHFRLAVDRAFTVPGSGTVVAGTVFDGEVAVGDHLMASPSGVPVRVRGIQQRGYPTECAEAGERCALNLAGTNLEAVARGDWVLAAPIHAPTKRLDVRVTLLACEPRPLKHWTPLHLHLATADVSARISLPGESTLAPGSTAIAQLVLARPVGALNGDRFILRDQSARRTLGGGTVLDPHARTTRRATAARRAELGALELGSPEAALSELLADETRCVDIAHFERVFNLKAERASAIFAAAGVTVLGKKDRTGVTPLRIDRLRGEILGALRGFHEGQPRAAGIEPDALRKKIWTRLPSEAFQTLLHQLAEERKIEIASNLVCQAGHDTTAGPEDQRLWDLVLPALRQSGFAPTAVSELAAALNLKVPALKDFLYRKSRKGEVIRMPKERFYPRATLAQLAAIAQTLVRTSPSGFTVAQYRDAAGIGRGLAIEILECLDNLGITQRVGDARKIRRDFVAILGAAEPE
jgi:selenocysteine-specific elongation factor